MTTKILGRDKPHLAWSKYWSAYVCSFKGLQRLGSTAEDAYASWHRAKLSGAKR